MNNVLEKIKAIITVKFVVGIVLGGIGGYLYYYYVGCNSGTCPITSNPYASIAYGLFFGGAIAYNKKKKVLDSDNEQ